MTPARRTALGFVLLWFLLGGIVHFAATDVEVRMVPPWLPAPRTIVLVSGVFELLGAAALLPRRTRRMAGIGLFWLTVAVTPANVQMLIDAGRWPVPVWLLVARLPLQLVLLWLIWWSAVRRPNNGS